MQNTLQVRVYDIKEFVHSLMDEGYNSTIIIRKPDSSKPPVADKATRTASQMIPEETRDQMIQSCKNPRDRALISFMNSPRPKRPAGPGISGSSVITGIPQQGRKTIPQEYQKGTNGYRSRARVKYYPGSIARAARAACLYGVFPCIIWDNRITAMVTHTIPMSDINVPV